MPAVKLVYLISNMYDKYWEFTQQDFSDNALN
jgi:hypothetical protein